MCKWREYNFKTSYCLQNVRPELRKAIEWLKFWETETSLTAAPNTFENPPKKKVATRY